VSILRISRLNAPGCAEKINGKAATVSWYAAEVHVTAATKRYPQLLIEKHEAAILQNECEVEVRKREIERLKKDSRGGPAAGHGHAVRQFGHP